MAEYERTEEEMLLGEIEKLAPYRPELAELQEHLKKQPKGPTQEGGPYAIGLALSGGGIRSASVSLGVMQKLAEADLLRHVDYLSTVSGGGYIGSALTWWLRKRDGGSSHYGIGRDFPYGVLDPTIPETPRGKKEPLTPLQYLRAQGNYLAPGNGITLWSGLAVVLRSIFLNLMVWIPTMALLMLVLLELGQVPLLRGLPIMIRMAVPGALETVADLVGSSTALDVDETIPPLFLLSLLIAILLFALFLLGSLGHSLLSWTDNIEPPGDSVKQSVSKPAGDKSSDAAASSNQRYGWLLVGATGLVSLLTFVLMLVWLQPVVEPLFGALPTDVKPLPGALPQDATTDVETLPWGVLFGLLFWCLAAAATWICFKLCGVASKDQQLNASKQTVVKGALAVLLVAIAAAVGFSQWKVGWLHQVALSLRLLFAVTYLVYLYYLCSLLTRHFLRSQATGETNGTSRRPTPSRLQYHARRLFEWFYGRSLVFGLAFTALAILPLLDHYIDFRLGGVWTAVGLAIAAGGQIWGRVAGHGKFTSIVIMLGAALFAYGVMLVGYRLALTTMSDDATQNALIVSVMIVALIAGWFVNTNEIGLHRFYRDRLMEAFMPDDDQLSSDRNEMAGEANEFRLTSAWAGKDGHPNGPYHIVNANLVLSNSDNRKYRLRAGDNFLLSPLYVGSSATSWYETDKTDNRDLTLASAMAISGAAANPRGGAGGRGLTRNPLVSLAMSLLNVRLGYWIPSPRYLGRRRLLPVRPNHFWPGGVYALGAAWGLGYHEDAKWLELADGGHFENLAIYELVRRRCGLIIVCDGGQDNASSYADLVTAVQRIGEDLGATIRFDMEVKNASDGKFLASGPARMIAKPDNADFPKGAEFAEKGYCVASIDYGERGKDGWPKTGTIIYLKSALIRDLGIRGKGYRGAHADFPNESTGDQFFDDEQFEAYREVGYKICSQMVADLGLAAIYGHGRPGLQQLRENDIFRPTP